MEGSVAFIVTSLHTHLITHFGNHPRNLSRLEIAEFECTGMNLFGGGDIVVTTRTILNGPLWGNWKGLAYRSLVTGQCSPFVERMTTCFL